MGKLTEPHPAKEAAALCSPLSTITAGGEGSLSGMLWQFMDHFHRDFDLVAVPWVD